MKVFEWFKPVLLTLVLVLASLFLIGLISLVMFLFILPNQFVSGTVFGIVISVMMYLFYPIMKEKVEKEK